MANSPTSCTIPFVITYVNASDDPRNNKEASFGRRRGARWCLDEGRGCRQADRGLENEQPGHRVPGGASPSFDLVEPGAWCAPSHGSHDRCAHPQQSLQLDQEPGCGARRHSAAACGPPPRASAGARRGALTKQRRNDRADSARHRKRRPGASRRVAELPDGHGTLPELLRRTRGSPSRAAVHGGSAAWPAAAAERRGGHLAMDGTSAGVTFVPGWMWRATIAAMVRSPMADRARGADCLPGAGHPTVRAGRHRGTVNS